MWVLEIDGKVIKKFKTENQLHEYCEENGIGKYSFYKRSNKWKQVK